MFGGFLFCIGLTIAVKELIKEVAEPVYKVPEKKYPEPPRFSNGTILVQNNALYKSDIQFYGLAQATKWAREGKYNLNVEDGKAYIRDFERRRW